MSLQINTLYATQVFCHDNQFPKGQLIKKAVNRLLNLLSQWTKQQTTALDTVVCRMDIDLDFHMALVTLIT